jgi:hypothetical protein
VGGGGNAVNEHDVLVETLESGVNLGSKSGASDSR